MKHKTDNTGASGRQVLVYSKLLPGPLDLYEIEEDNPTNITLGDSLNYNPVYSPDGCYIVFTSERDGTAHLFCLDTHDKSKAAARLTNNPNFEDQVAFSPNGQFIYFVSTRDHGIADIYVMKFDPNAIQDIKLAINLTKGEGNNLRPNISPDGKEMAFSSNRFHSAPKISLPQPPSNYRATDIFKLNLESRKVKRLTDSEEWDGSPVWSQDGSTIYFYSTRGEKKEPHIYSMTSEGDNIKMISPDHIPADSPKLAPNGKIAFTGYFQDHWDIAMIDPNSTVKEVSSVIKNPSRINFQGAFFHPKTSKCIAFGDAPQKKPNFYAENPNGLPKPLGVGPFLINRTQRTTPKKMDLYAVRGFFPQYDPKHKQVLCVEEFNKVVLHDLEGNERKVIFTADNRIIGLSWSPDKAWFVGAMGDPFTPKRSDIWSISMDGRTKINLTPAMEGHKMFPRISVDNNTIVFCSREGHEMPIYSVKKDTLEVRKLTNNLAINFAPAISPDGKKVVYSTATREENYNLYMTNITGEGEPERLTHSKFADMHPTFSPDGKFVAFASERGGLLDETPLMRVFCPQPYGDNFTIQISSGQVNQLTESKGESSLVDWTEVSDDTESETLALKM